MLSGTDIPFGLNCLAFTTHQFEIIMSQVTFYCLSGLEMLHVATNLLILNIFITVRIIRKNQNKGLLGCCGKQKTYNVIYVSDNEWWKAGRIVRR